MYIELVFMLTLLFNNNEMHTMCTVFEHESECETFDDGKSILCMIYMKITM